MQVVATKIKGTRVPPRQPNNTKPPRSERLDDRSASTVGATPNTTHSFHRNPFFAKPPHSHGSPIRNGRRHATALPEGGRHDADYEWHGSESCSSNGWRQWRRLRWCPRRRRTAFWNWGGSWQRYWKEVGTAAIGSGKAATVAAATGHNRGGNRGGDFSLEKKWWSGKFRNRGKGIFF